jgi:hypothetical protein
VIPLLLALALAPPAPVAVREVNVPGEVVDVIDRPGDEALLSTHHRGKRKLVPLAGRGTIPAPGDAVFVDSCAGRIVYATPAGLQDDAGVALPGDALFRVPDPARLFRAPLCSRAGELWLPTPDGVKTPSGVLRFPRAPRAYTGEGHGSLRGRDYGAALSLYAPQLHEADLDGDGDLDVVMTWRRQAAAFRRGPKGLEPKGARLPLPRAPGADLRFHVGDLDDDGRAELVVTALKGLIPERTQAWVMDEVLTKPRTSKLWDRAGFTAPLSVDGGLLLFHIDTSVVAMGAVLVTGKLPLVVERRTARGFERLLELEIAASVGGGITGNLPALVDLDRDGDLDLVDTGADQARVYLQARGGFPKAPSHAWPAAGVDHVHGTSDAVVLVTRMKRGKSKVFVIARGPERSAARRLDRR